jgi:hypothetical protein
VVFGHHHVQLAIHHEIHLGFPLATHVMLMLMLKLMMLKLGRRWC